MPSQVEEPPVEVVEDLPRPLLSHLDDLRGTLVRAIAGWGVATMAAYALFPHILRFLVRPPVQHLVYTSPMEPFMVQMKLSFILGLMLALPWLMYQAWAFVAPGLRPHERRVFLRLIPASYALFLAGGAMGFFIAVPLGLKFLLSYSTAYLVPYITLNAYMSYLGYITLGTGALFQFPIVLWSLSYLGILSRDTVARYRRHVFLGLLIAAAFITPSADITGQVLIAVPAYLLFELTLLTMRFTQGSKAASA